jgi:hypothetical protein
LHTTPFKIVISSHAIPEKYTKRSSDTLLPLVYFSAEQTLHDIFDPTVSASTEYFSENLIEIGLRSSTVHRHICLVLIFVQIYT